MARCTELELQAEQPRDRCAQDARDPLQHSAQDEIPQALVGMSHVISTVINTFLITLMNVKY